MAKLVRHLLEAVLLAFFVERETGDDGCDALVEGFEVPVHMPGGRGLDLGDLHDAKRSHIDAEPPEQAAGPKDDRAALTDPAQQRGLGQGLVLIADEPCWDADLPQDAGDLGGHL
ncbi:hypothetical protein ABZZ36_33620 [Actinacidiphila glaucinigra]|uniref:hypothetical protein n=1 Tax=Actinacidiphila glaucinigra TaxID=235986 RepID=UPI0033BB7C6C